MSTYAGTKRPRSNNKLPSDRAKSKPVNLGEGVNLGRVMVTKGVTENNIVLPNDNLLDFWKTLWHVDVFKDHANDYNSAIVNSFLPDSIYHTSQSINDINISISDTSASRTPSKKGEKGKVVEFSDLFQYLTKLDFKGLCDRAIGDETTAPITVELNSNLVGPNVIYDIKIFDPLGKGMTAFVEGNVAMYIDTASHVPEMMTNFRKESSGRSLTYTYTREIESDPADKMTYVSIAGGPPVANQDIENRKSFFYELEYPKNSQTISYNNYKEEGPNDGLSYFYCKYPLFLKNNGPTDISEPRINNRKYKLDVELSYNRDGNMIVIAEGANTAGGARKGVNALLKIKGVKQDDLIKELVFISKHHGDVAQSLVKFRDVQMKNPTEEKEINTKNFKGAFVSIDVNAIIKALTIQMPYIFMYPPKKDKIIVWKNQSLSTPEARYSLQRAYVYGLLTQYLAELNTYNAMVNKINTNKDNFDTIIKETIETVSTIKMSLADANDTYKKYLQKAFSLAILSKFVPKEKLVELPTAIGINFNEQFPEGITDNTIALQGIQSLKELQDLIIREKANFVIPENYGNLEMFGADKKARVKVEKEIGLEFARVRFAEGSGRTYNFKERRGDFRIEDMWSFIDFVFTVGGIRGGLPDSLICRNGPKINSSWGIDLIQYVYTELKKYDSDLAKKVPINLYSIIQNIDNLDTDSLADKINTLSFALSLIGIEDFMSIKGGRRARHISRKKKGGRDVIVRAYPSNKMMGPRMNMTAKVSQKIFPKEQVMSKQEFTPKILELEQQFVEYYVQELTEIENHVEQIIGLAYLYGHADLLEQKRFDTLGLIILDNFFAKQYGKDFTVGEKFRQAWHTQFNEFIKSKKGGGSLSDFLNFVKYLVNNREVSVENVTATTTATTTATMTAEPVDGHILDIDDAKYYASYSIVKYYKYFIDQSYETVTDQYMVYCKLRLGKDGIYYKMRRYNFGKIEKNFITIRQLLNELDKLDESPWETSESAAAAITYAASAKASNKMDLVNLNGGKRKTLKKRKSKMAKTIKHLKKLLISGGR